jgi:hypothetical protein
MNWRDPRNHIEPGKNLVVDLYVIALTKLDLVSLTMGTNYHGLWLDLRVDVLMNVVNNGTQETRWFMQVHAS